MRLAVFNYRADEEEFFIKFCAQYHVEAVYIKEPPTAESIEKALGCDCASIITSPVRKAELDAFQKAGVRFVSTRTIGFDHIDMNYAKELGIGVGNVSYSPNSVAEYTVMLILMANRRLKTIMARGLGQDYSLKGVRGTELRKQTVGVVGTGQIGRNVIHNLSGFGCNIIAYDKYENDEVKQYARYVSMDELLAKADVITFHIPGNDDNYHMIDKSAFGKMKDGAVLINCSRYGVVDEEALAAAKAAGVRAEDCTVFDDSLAACRGARAARMRVVGVYDGLFAQDEAEMRSFCDVYIKGFEELLWMPEKEGRT